MAATRRVGTGIAADGSMKKRTGENNSLRKPSLSPFPSNLCSHSSQRICGRGCGIYFKMNDEIKPSQVPHAGRLQHVATSRFLRSLQINPGNHFFCDLRKAESHEHKNNLLNSSSEFNVEEVDNVQPLFCGYQLIGDSILLRFAEQILQNDCVYVDGLRFLGLCVSGQTTDQLCLRLKNKFAPIGSRAILLIGTNDLLQNKDLEDIKKSLEILIDILIESVDKLVILSLPPIPKLEDQKDFSLKLRDINTFLKLCSRKYKNVLNVDITKLFQVGEEKNSNMKYFERWYDVGGSKPDLIHPNYEGMVKMSEKIIKSRVLNSLD